MNFSQPLSQADPEIFASISREHEREETGLELIASENYVTKAVLEAQGSILTNKYAEGYPGKRYYGGCAFVDEVESLAISRLLKIFGGSAAAGTTTAAGSLAANVQPHSGSQANMAAYLALMNPGDTLMGMDLSHGGHLTHGSPVNFSGKFFKVTSYGLNPKTHRLDYDEILSKAQAIKPKVIVAGASAYPRIIDFEKFGEIAKKVGAHLVVDMAHIAGLVAAKLHPTPIPHATYTTSTTHKTLRGPRGGVILGSEEAIKNVNKLIFPGIQGGPLMHVIAAKAVSFGEALKPEFKTYQEQVIKNARKMAETLMSKGLDLVTGGTENHLMLVDLTRFEGGTVSGKDGETWLDLAGITVNKNTVPGETRSPFVTSGLRIGTPAITSRGIKEPEIVQIATWIIDALRSKGDSAVLKGIRGQVKELCSSFPLYH